MTHALYRKGTKKNLGNDLVIMAAVAKGFNDQGSVAKERRFFEIVQRHGPVNMGEITIGSVHQMGAEEIKERLPVTALVHAVFTDPATLARVLQEVKEADLGLSITVSGLFEALGECCGKVGLHPYGVEQSLGIIGRTDLLPEGSIVEIGTMCGHGLVSLKLIELMAERIREGTTTAEAAARELTKQCVCGIFNPVRAQALLEEMAESRAKKEVQ
jgi:hypothetical protein